MALPTKFHWIVHSLQKSWRWYVWHSALTLLLFSGLKRGFCLTLHTPFTIYPGEIYWLRVKAILLTTWMWPLLPYGNAPSSALVNHNSCLSLLFNSPGAAGDNFKAYTTVSWCLFSVGVCFCWCLRQEILTVAVVEDTFYTPGVKHLPSLWKGWLVAPCNDWLVVLWFIEKNWAIYKILVQQIEIFNMYVQSSPNICFFSQHYLQAKN